MLTGWKIEIDNKRARAFQTILATFKILLSDDDTPVYSTGANSLAPFLEKTQLLDDAFKQRATRVFTIFNNVFMAHKQIFENNNYRHSTRFAPIEFVGVALLIHRYPERSVGMLSGDIKTMRDFLRKERQELRSNTTTFKTIVGFIDNLEAYRGGQGVIENGKDMDNIEDDEQADYSDKKPKIVDGVAVSESAPKARATPQKKMQAPPAPPSAPAPRSRRGSVSSASNNNASAPNRASGQTFAIPTAPLAYREMEKERDRHRQQPGLPPPMTPVAPMSRYNNGGSRNQDSSFHMRSSNGDGTSYNSNTNRTLTASSFKPINAPSPFLPDLDADPTLPPPSLSSLPIHARKRVRREEDNMEELDIDNPRAGPTNGSGNRGQRSSWGNGGDNDILMTGYRHVDYSYNAPRGGGNQRGGASGKHNENRNGYTPRGGYRGRGGMHINRGGPNGGRRIKQERIGGGRKEIQYGPFTMDQ